MMLLPRLFRECTILHSRMCKLRNDAIVPYFHNFYQNIYSKEEVEVGRMCDSIVNLHLSLNLPVKVNDLDDVYEEINTGLYSFVVYNPTKFIEKMKSPLFTEKWDGLELDVTFNGWWTGRYFNYTLVKPNPIRGDFTNDRELIEALKQRLQRRLKLFTML